MMYRQLSIFPALPAKQDGGYPKGAPPTFGTATVRCKAAGLTFSLNHRTRGWKGPHIPILGRGLAAPHQIRLPRALPTVTLHTSRDVAPALVCACSTLSVEKEGF